MKFPNPLLPGFNPDPSITRVDQDYYLVTSSFEFLPGLPIYKSRNLIDWTLIGHVATREGQLQMTDVPTIGGAWAPTIRFRNGVFYVVVTDELGRGNLIFQTKNPAGDWSQGVHVDVQGIDPDLAWDSEGNCYMTYSGLRLHGVSQGKHLHLGIQQVRIDIDTGAVLEEPRNLWSGTGLMFPEAPHLYEIEGVWYLLIAEGGTSRGHSVSIARGAHPTGPFEGAPLNPVLSARSTSRSVQNTGHGDLFQTPEGDWAMVLLGMRPGGMTRAFSPLGRETFATNVSWVDGWPVIEAVELTDVLDAPVFVDRFESDFLSLEWITIRRLANAFSTYKRGNLSLTGEGRSMDHEEPSFVGRRQSRLDGVVTADVSVVGVGGLSVRYDENAHYDIEINGGQIIARSVLQLNRNEVKIDVSVDSPITLFIRFEKPVGSDIASLQTSDTISLGYKFQNGPEVVVASFDGRYLSAEVNCSFTGRVIGVYSVTGSLELHKYEEVGN